MENRRELKRMEAASLCAAQQIRKMLRSEDVATLAQLQMLMYVCERSEESPSVKYSEAFKESLVGQIADQRPDLENEIGWKN